MGGRQNHKKKKHSRAVHGDKSMPISILSPAMEQIPEPSTADRLARLFINTCTILGAGGVALGGIMRIIGFVILALCLPYVAWELRPWIKPFVARRRVMSLILFISCGTIIGGAFGYGLWVYYGKKEIPVSATTTKPPTAAEIADEVAKRFPPNTNETQGISDKVDVKVTRAPSTPLVRRRSVTALIPFNKDPRSTGIMYDENRSDPLLLTYVDLAGLGHTGPHVSSTYQVTPITDGEAQDFVLEVMRYFVLRSIEELQRPRSLISVSENNRVSQEKAVAVPVPDGIQYPADQLRALLDESKLGNRELHLWNKTFQMPKGAKIQLAKNKVIISRDGQFTITFDLESGPKSVGALPPNFRPIDSWFAPLKQENILLFPVNINMQFQWNQDYSLADPYSEWAESLFFGIEKLFKQPHP
jgi:hypothetical protein